MKVKWKTLIKWLIASPIIIPLAIVCLIAIGSFESFYSISNISHRIAYRIENHKIGEYVFNNLEKINKWVTK